MDYRIKRHKNVWINLNKNVLTWAEFNHFFAVNEQIIWSKIDPIVFEKMKKLNYSLNLENVVKIVDDLRIRSWNDFLEANKETVEILEKINFQLDFLTFHQSISFLNKYDQDINVLYINKGIASPLLLEIAKIKENIKMQKLSDTKNTPLDKNIVSIQKLFTELQTKNFNEKYKPKKLKFWMIIVIILIIGLIILIVCACVLFLKK